MADEIELTVQALGGEGDGIATLPHGGEGGARVYVPFALPGEKVRARVTPTADGLRGTVVEILQRSPDRIEPACPNFTKCGGCAMEHLAPAPYAAWKRDILVEALAHVGLPDVAVEPLVAVPPATRRRATFFAHRPPQNEKGAGAVKLGFQARASHDVIDLTECAALSPALIALLAPLRDLLARLLPPNGRAEAMVNQLDDGLDIVLRTPGKLPVPFRQMMADFATARNLLRICWQSLNASGPVGTPEPIVTRRSALVSFGKAQVALPPGAFLQATKAGEALLVEAVLAAFDGAKPKRIADLFCGAGAFSFPLVGLASVLAIDGDPGLVGALRKAADAAGIGNKLATETRDLMKRPLIADDLKKFDAVVFDPPRAGAASQAGRLAASKIPLVVAVSCNPTSFARDAKLLVDGGYRLERVLPVDQFLWTPHLEVVGVFRKGR
ncbi:MAG TPA: class I SAM-dependent RNA methyltransferase [Alphaproteobacteria bacterium]|nr:class I SAM-dependent RNA methyltransferase [Alphaproteobacteria bacterium]